MIRRARWLALGLALGMAQCILPTDQGNALQVWADTSELRLVVGESFVMGYRVEGTTNTANVTVGFLSNDESVVRTESDGTFLALAEGATKVIVAAQSFESASADTVTVQVVPDITFASVSPDTVRFGDVVTIIGTALDPSRLASLSVGGWQAPVKSFALGWPTGMDTLRVWAPPGATLSTAVSALHEAGGTASAPITVLPEDLYEPNDNSPAVVDNMLDLNNPALAYEAGSTVDWYRIRNVSGPFTVVVWPNQPQEIGFSHIRFREPTASLSDMPAWGWDSEIDQICNGRLSYSERAFFLNENAGGHDVPFHFYAPQFDSVDLVIESYAPGLEARPYEIEVFTAATGQWGEDDYEPNDICTEAYNVGTGIDGFINFGSPTDFEWFEIDVATTSFIDVSLDCEICDTGVPWLGLSLFEDAPDPDDPMRMKEIEVQGDFDSVSLNAPVPPGKYYLMIQNYFMDNMERLALSISVN